MYANKFHSKSKPPKELPYFCTFEWYYNLVQKFGSDKQAKFQALADEFGKPDIALVASHLVLAVKKYCMYSSNDVEYAYSTTHN